MKAFVEVTTYNIIDIPVSAHKSLNHNDIDKILADYHSLNQTVVETKLIDGNGRARKLKAVDWETRVALMDESGETVAEEVD
jgi:hypothetical protein